MVKTILFVMLSLFIFSGCFHQEPEVKKETPKEVKKDEPQKKYYKVPKLNPSFYYN